MDKTYTLPTGEIITYRFDTTQYGGAWVWWTTETVLINRVDYRVHGKYSDTHFIVSLRRADDKYGWGTESANKKAYALFEPLRLFLDTMPKNSVHNDAVVGAVNNAIAKVEAHILEAQKARAELLALAEELNENINAVDTDTEGWRQIVEIRIHCPQIGYIDWYIKKAKKQAY